MENLKLKKSELSNEEARICVPITGDTQAKIVEEAKQIKRSHADVIEWRCDFYDHHADIKKVIETLKLIHEQLEDKPLIFTYRTVAEGGEGNLSVPEYLLLYKTVILSKLVDIVDVQLLIGDSVIQNIAKHAKLLDVRLLLSNHDMKATPTTEKIINRIKLMHERGADICKVAYMPVNENDVQAVVDAIAKVREEIPFVIGISMGELGVSTRIDAAKIGSCITFASLAKESAPGQMNVEVLYDIWHPASK